MKILSHPEQQYPVEEFNSRPEQAEERSSQFNTGKLKLLIIRSRKKKKMKRDFLDGPVAKTLCFQCRVPSSGN